MTTQNMLIGIDLGTTNSEIAINNNGKIEIIKNIFGDEYTPSVFGVDKAKNKIVGKRAYERLFKDASEEEFANHKAEIKRLMGTSETIYFKRFELEMSPEEISAEILKSLKEDILRKYPDFDTNSAVISVPAAFSTLQSEATKRAGKIAGFKHIVLLQEPIAAAIAYGFANTKNENWLIYDFGGGTFDVALIALKDGILSVLGHRGDNYLGGKNIDWEIVDNIIVPKLIEKYSLTDFSRDNKKYRNIFAKLKYIAETSKIYLSQYAQNSMEIDGIGTDDKNKDIYLSINFSRNEFEKLLEPIIDKTIELSRETLNDAGIKNTAVEKIILVGGPTQIPYIKKRLETDLKITVDPSIDPLTVVARGACVFAISQKVPKELQENKTKKSRRKTYNLNLNYDSLTSETEQMITGNVEELKDTNDYFIQIQSESGFYNSSKIKLKNGKFFDNIVLEPNRSNLYWIYLFDKDGNSLSIDPYSFTIMHGLSVPNSPLPHSIGIVLAQKDIKNNFIMSDIREIIFEKGLSLPAKHHDTYKTIRKLMKTDIQNPLKILIDEGESEIPDRNIFICELGINGNDLPYDLPEATEVDITININESRELFITAYIPLINLTLDARSTIKDETINVKDLETELKVQAERAKTISVNCSIEEKRKIEDIIHTVQIGVMNANIDEDEKRKANKQIKDLKIIFDNIEKEKEMPQLINEFQTRIDDVQKIINEYAEQKDKTINTDQLVIMRTEGEKAIEDNDKIMLIRVNELIHTLGAKAFFSNPATWLFYFQKIISEDHNFTNEQEAQYFITKGKRAIELGDVDELKRCVSNLVLLLPRDEQEAFDNLSGITK